MSRLVLVKHAMPAIDEAKPARLWPLSDEGRAAAGRLAEKLRALAPAHVCASSEPKAADTGRVIAAALGAPIRLDEDLVETFRETVGWLPRAEVEAGIEELFRRPGDLVYGEETGDAAHARFDRGVQRALAASEGATTVIAAHGTVISLWVGRRLGVDPMALWRRLPLPGAVVMAPDEAGFELVTAES